MYNGIRDLCDCVHVFVEQPPSPLKMIRRRIKKLGWLVVFGQLLFLLGCRLASSRRHRRINRIACELNLTLNPPENVNQVGSINDESLKDRIREFTPDLVIVNGTRIISESLLNAIEAPFVNTHVGITPNYRGVHGGYWALASGDIENFGVTVHLVDKGIDTGSVLYQARFKPGPNDSFGTYPIRQLAAAIPLMRRVIEDVKAGILSPQKVVGNSKLWSHPTIFGYLYRRLLKGVK